MYAHWNVIKHDKDPGLIHCITTTLRRTLGLKLEQLDFVFSLENQTQVSWVNRRSAGRAEPDILCISKHVRIRTEWNQMTRKCMTHNALVPLSCNYSLFIDQREKTEYSHDPDCSTDQISPYGFVKDESLLFCYLFPINGKKSNLLYRT